MPERRMRVRTAVLCATMPMPPHAPHWMEVAVSPVRNILTLRRWASFSKKVVGKHTSVEVRLVPRHHAPREKRNHSMSGCQSEIGHRFGR